MNTWWLLSAHSVNPTIGRVYGKTDFDRFPSALILADFSLARSSNYTYSHMIKEACDILLTDFLRVQSISSGV